MVGPGSERESRSFLSMAWGLVDRRWMKFEVDGGRYNSVDGLLENYAYQG